MPVFLDALPVHELAGGIPCHQWDIYIDGPASLKRQLSATISLATAVDGTLVEVMKIVAEWSPEDMIPAHISQAFSLICSIFNSGILFPPPLSSDLNPAFAMMKTIQAIIHCSDGVVILVHAEGDVGQSPVWKTADYILMPVTSQKPHILACDVPTILRNCDHMWCLCNIF